jgi:hypothetical protein
VAVVFELVDGKCISDRENKIDGNNRRAAMLGITPTTVVARTDTFRSISDIRANCDVHLHNRHDLVYVSGN